MPQVDLLRRGDPDAEAAGDACGPLCPVSAMLVRIALMKLGARRQEVTSTPRCQDANRDDSFQHWSKDQVFCQAHNCENKHFSRLAPTQGTVLTLLLSLCKK